MIKSTLRRPLIYTRGGQTFLLEGQFWIPFFFLGRIFLLSRIFFGLFDAYWEELSTNFVKFCLYVMYCLLFQVMEQVQGPHFGHVWSIQFHRSENQMPCHLLTIHYSKQTNATYNFERLILFNQNILQEFCFLKVAQKTCFLNGLMRKKEKRVVAQFINGSRQRANEKSCFTLTVCFLVRTFQLEIRF